MDGYRYVEFSFAALSPTYAEVPRRAVLVATVPGGADKSDIVMLVGSATAGRWKKGAEPAIRGIVESFRATLFTPARLRSTS